MLENFPSAAQRVERMRQQIAALELAGGFSGPLTLVNSPQETWDGVLSTEGVVLVGPGSGTLNQVMDGLDEAGYEGPWEMLRQESPADWLLLLGQRAGNPLAESLPLHGVSVALTRESSQARASQQQLEALGARVELCPVLAFAPPDDPQPLEECLQRLSEYRWILFTSVNGVHSFLHALKASGRDLRALGKAHLGAIGPATAAALGDWHLSVDCLPAEYVAEALLAALPEVRGSRVLIARAQEAREVLPKGLRALGAEVDVVPVYRTVQPVLEASQVCRARQCEWVFLTSSSGARHYAAVVGVESAQRVLAIGPITEKTARELGWTQIETAKTYTLEGMIEHLRAAHSLVKRLPVLLPEGAGSP